MTEVCVSVPLERLVSALRHVRECPHPEEATCFTLRGLTPYTGTIADRKEECLNCFVHYLVTGN